MRNPIRVPVKLVGGDPPIRSAEAQAPAFLKI